MIKFIAWFVFAGLFILTIYTSGKLGEKLARGAKEDNQYSEVKPKFLEAFYSHGYQIGFGVALLWIVAFELLFKRLI